MKRHSVSLQVPSGFSFIRHFGRAVLLRSKEGCWQLSGGKHRERIEAREWVSLFCHEALVDTREPDRDDRFLSRVRVPCRKGVRTGSSPQPVTGVGAPTRN